MEPVALPGWMMGYMAFLVVYIGLCAGMIAAKHGKNPLLYGLIAVISPFNLILLGIWAFGSYERQHSDQTQ